MYMYVCRMELQRDLKKKGHHKSDPKTSSSSSSGPSSSSSSGSGADNADMMLTMAMNMLRCSICNDRFKSVVLTRCWHLFCRYIQYVLVYECACVHYI